jgi:solute carrier family 39 (zinc transporter), member 1/2/3
MSCSSALASCEAGWADANSSLAHALAIVEAITPDPCLPTAGARRDLPLRIAAVFIVFVASFAGVLTTTAGKVAERFAPSAFAIALGKTVGTGVVLACALVHMLLPADKSLTSACLPLSFHAADYGAYAYLFAMYAALGMHLVEYAIMHFGASASSSAHKSAAEARLPVVAVAAATSASASPAPTPTQALTPLPGPAGAAENLFAPKPTLAATGGECECAADASRRYHANPQTAVHLADIASDRAAPPDQHSTVAALSMEFGLSVHSLFIGLAMAVAGDSNFRVLLAALTFHQFFEGVGLGARLAEASMTQLLRLALMLVFSVAAPVGISVGIALMNSPNYNPNGGDFLISQGSLDGVCAGILLFLGFQMLSDLSHDLERFCDSPGVANAALRRTAFFVALWGGAGAMASIGKFM